MSKRWQFAALLLSSAIVAPHMALAQSAPSSPAPAPPSSVAVEEEAAAADPAAPADPVAATPAQPDVSVPGGDDVILVRGRRRNVQRSSTQVVSVLSSEAIAKTGEGDIAGSLQRVTGLSVVGNGFVYVRGLGDRYSLALLNGSPLPSPEPLKRVVPLVLFPTNIIASSLVQKSYSVNFPGEFGGGVINLTTKSIPEEPFLTIGASAAYDSETTGKLGYVYQGGDDDWTGFDSGVRDIPPALQAYFDGDRRLSSGLVDDKAIASQLVNSRNSIVQRDKRMPANWGANLTGGTSFELGSDATLGVIATAGMTTRHRTRDTTQQTANSADLSTLETNFQRVITDSRVVLNSLLGFGLEVGDQKLRWTNLFIRDTLKQARLGVGTRETTSSTATLMQQDTAWFARQLFNTQLVGEFKPMKDLTVELRGGYANSQRKAPDEFSYEYFRSNDANDPLGDSFINRLNNGQQGRASVQYSNLDENLWSGGVDLGYRFSSALRATVGYAFSDTKRRTEVRSFSFVAPSDFPIGVATLRPDLLLQPGVINAFNIGLIDINETNPIFDATLRTHAGYGQLNFQVTEDLGITGGVRYETARQDVVPVDVFADADASSASTRLNNDYWLPAIALTYQVTPQLQLRASASKTIARPQFRELIFQPFTDPDNNRLFRGNPLLVDSELKNAEARAEYYFRGEQRIAVAGFYKKIKNPIETYASFSDNAVLSSFVNAPLATLYGVEVEAVKFFRLGDFHGPRRLVLSGNYTFTKSSLDIKDDDAAAVFGSPNNFATDYFSDGDPLTGQSDHIVNLEIGLENENKVSQQTILVNFASERVTNRGAANQPDIIERPGITLDFVAREGFTIAKRDIEVKFEARNLLRKRYTELQEFDGNKVFYNRYRLGTVFSLGASMKF
ncbi:MAG: TonB-dependent receptor [Pseudomonadota bacterium]|nr:TonB-dependent receptor [Pseudomonadota bacterium]